MDVMFAKIVTDTAGKDHMLIEGGIYEIVGDPDVVNPVVDAIVRALRRAGSESHSSLTCGSAIGNNVGGQLVGTASA